MGAAVCLEAARMLGEVANHVIGIDALLFPELFGAHAARKSPAARVLLRTPLAARTIDSWVERFFVAPYDPAVRNTVRQTMLNTSRPVLDTRCSYVQAINSVFLRLDAWRAWKISRAM
jgi:hypothetical protein